MPSSTPIFALPYPSPSDRPCDFDEQWCDFTEAINNVFDTFQTGIDRTVPAVPAAKLMRRGTVQVENQTAIPFDTVVLDTAGMSDIEVDPFNVTVTRTGRYTIAAFVELAPPGTALNAGITMLVNGTSISTISAEIINRGGAFLYRLSAYRAAVSINAGDKIFVSYDVGAAGLRDVHIAWLSVVWHSDTETP